MPRDKVSSWLRKPNNPLVGISNTKRVVPSEFSDWWISIPRRLPTSPVIPLACSDPASIVNSSTGSCSTPSIVFVITRGLLTCSSNPSRLSVSIKTDKCNSPRPDSMYSPDSAIAKRIDTLVSSSFLIRSSNWRAVTNLPSRPAKGEVLAYTDTLNVGSSIEIVGSASGLLESAIVSPIDAFFIPEIATISPAIASFTSKRRSPWLTNTFSILAVSEIPSLLIRATVNPGLATPRRIFPITYLP
ncbi:MAG: hypothetical protein BWY68_00228 [bacterium ADurb.Bin400]|nr:MAG: hypothetical protein BWY68_00228 [bacterium ADurb.Bin400]